MRTSAGRWLALGAAVVLTVTGCGSTASHPHRAAATASASASASAHPTASSAPAGPSASPSPSQRPLLAVSMPQDGLSEKQKPVADVVLAYWRSYGKAVATRDLAASGLSKVVTSATGVSSTQKVVDSLKANNQHYRGSLVIKVRSIGFGGDTATVDVCVDQTKSRLVGADGTTVDEPDKQNILPIAHTMVRQDKTWLVDKLDSGGFVC